MRLPSMRPNPLIVPLSVALAAGSCSSPTDVGGYTVTYRAFLNGIATIDSVLYDNGTHQCTSRCNADATMVKLNNPSPTWSVVLSTVAPTGSMEVRLYGSGTAAGTANLVRIWMTATGVLAGDSTQITTAPAMPFQLLLPARGF